MKTTTSSSDTDHASSPSATSPDEARFKRANRRQVEMIMLSLNQRLDVDHPVRAVWAFVEGLDLTELYGKIKAVKGKAGAAAIEKTRKDQASLIDFGEVCEGRVAGAMRQS